MKKYTSKKYTYRPTQGVKTDFENLLQRFTETGTVRFEKFAEIWKEMKFSKYCAGRQTLREVREFVEECLKIAVQFWLPPSSFQVRAGALYLLYGLYHCQIDTPRVKIQVTPENWKSILEFQTLSREQQHLDIDYVFQIRVTPENWKSILEFQTLSREQQHLDIDYVFQKLKLDRAFRFVATQSEYNPYDYRNNAEGKTLPDSLKDDESLLSELYSSQVLNQLAAVHDQYHKMKVALAGDDYTDEPDTSLNIINNDLIQNIYRTLQSHKEKMAPHPASSQAHQSTSQESGSDSEQKYSSLSVKGALKQKAFGAYFADEKMRGPGRPPGPGRPKKVKIQEAVTSWEDPKLSACGRLKGRAPKIPLFGKDEEEVMGSSRPPNIGLVDMPDIDHILGKEKEEAEEKKKPSRKKSKKDQKPGRKKKTTYQSEGETDNEDDKKELSHLTSDDEIAVKREIKPDTSDDEWRDVDAEKDVKKSASKKLKKSPIKKGSKKMSLWSVSGDEMDTSPRKSPAGKSVRRRKGLSTAGIGDEGAALSDASPAKTPRKTARMSIENTDIIELKKLQGTKSLTEIDDSSSSQKGKGGKRMKKNIKKDTEADIENQGEVSKVPTSRKKKSSADTQETKSSKRKKFVDEGESSALKKMKNGTDIEENIKVAETSVKSEANEPISVNKLKKSVPKKAKLIVKTVVEKKGPTAQERLNMKIAQRIKEKRESQNLDDK